jgi:hypothetical protein
MRAGRLLLAIARLLFNERFLRSVARCTIADLQSEIAAAGSDRAARVRARWRGYTAFWRLVAAAPFASWSEDPHVNRMQRLIQERDLAAGHVLAGSAGVTLLGMVTLGAWTALVIGTGALVAWLIHVWYERHPSEVAMPRRDGWRSPQINFSSTDIAGNVGGLIFVVGSLLIVSVGLTSVFWFLFAGSIASCFVAWGLAVWHAHARAENSAGGRGPTRLLF